MGVELHDIACRFGGTPAVRGIDLTVADGEFLALVGPSGAGKTTLLRIIAGLQPGYTGQVRIGARDVTQVPARERNIGFVFQNYALFGHMSIADNVAFGLKVRPRARRPNRAAIGARVAELLELVQVAPLAKRYPAQLSGGQRQRVALARALATEPELLLLDEPFGALDPLVRKEIRGWLRGLHDRLGLTSILVTHDQEEALEVADRIAVLRDGRLEQIGTPQALEDHPATRFVHQFLGETVQFPAMHEAGRLRLSGAWSHVAATLPGWLHGGPPDRLHAEAPGPHAARSEPMPHAAKGEPVPHAVGSEPMLLSLRAYEIGLAAIRPGEAGARVLSVQRAGAFTRYRIMPADGGDSDAIAVLAPASLPSLTEGMSCRLDLSRAHLFAGDRLIAASATSKAASREAAA